MYFKIPEPFLLAGSDDYGINIDELLKRFHSSRVQRLGNEDTKWTVQEGTNGRGKVASAVLLSDPKTGERLVFCALEGDVVFTRQALYGNTVLVLAGIGDDVINNNIEVSLCRGSLIAHDSGSFQYLSTKTFLVFLYYQPRGSADPLWFA